MEYTQEQIEKLLTDKFDKNQIEYAEGNHVDDGYYNVLECVIEVVKELGIKVKE